jgi:hypothetical protein
MSELKRNTKAYTLGMHWRSVAQASPSGGVMSFVTSTSFTMRFGKSTPVHRDEKRQRRDANLTNDSRLKVPTKEIARVPIRKHLARRQAKIETIQHRQRRVGRDRCPAVKGPLAQSSRRSHEFLTKTSAQVRSWDADSRRWCNGRTAAQPKCACAFRTQRSRRRTRPTSSWDPVVNMFCKLDNNRVPPERLTRTATGFLTTTARP